MAPAASVLGPPAGIYQDGLFLVCTVIYVIDTHTYFPREQWFSIR